ncbi:Uncharacterised protein [Enterobacter cloacae]|nr:Uncharacterised protein [Enterobacter cloacae]
MGIAAIDNPGRVNFDAVFLKAEFITRQAIDRDVIIERGMQAGNFGAAMRDKRVC